MPEPRTLIPDDRTLRFGADLASAQLGLDALYAAERSADAAYAGLSIERLVVLDLSNGHPVTSFADYAAAATAFTDLRQQSSTLLEADRRLYYRQVCESALNFITWRQQGLPFSARIAGFLHVPAEPATPQELDEPRGEMRTILTDLGYAGDLAVQFAAWEERHRVPPEAVAGVLTELLTEAWDRTAPIVEIPAPKSDGI